MCASPELDGVGVGVRDVEELPETSVEAGQARESRRVAGAVLSLLMVWHA